MAEWAEEFWRASPEKNQERRMVRRWQGGSGKTGTDMQAQEGRGGLLEREGARRCHPGLLRCKRCGGAKDGAQLSESPGAGTENSVLFRTWKPKIPRAKV